MTMPEESRRGDQRPDQDLPGSVSDQNAEEQPGSGGARSGEQDPRAGERDPSGGGSGEGSESGGESREGSQSTGNPDSAG